MEREEEVKSEERKTKSSENAGG
jgi:hypothetical protein